ncbi:alpha-hydroxy acid oxidase [Salinibacterium sp. ZJ450]|uniref:alpha-hydroxy acid oxidase n=1 Tax=Salinibacterium sp. ZJ450 TaxID=2708338 RepID=UPI00142275CE|nr:alpha-hydroxy acid oxidase [Salinibacterium sp. ZJ450]
MKSKTKFWRTSIGGDGVWFNFLITEPLKFAFAADENAGVVADVVANLYDPSATFEDLKWKREAWGGPMVIKGIQTLDDAKRSVDFGPDGLIVSNHGGRQLDRAPIPLRLLPEVVDAVGEQTEVMIDTGIMNGADIVASIALGAKFAWIGRAYLCGLMAAGEEGVVKTVEILESEIVRTMKLLGVNKIADLYPDHVRLLEQQGMRQAVRLVS